MSGILIYCQNRNDTFEPLGMNYMVSGIVHASLVPQLARNVRNVIDPWQPLDVWEVEVAISISLGSYHFPFLDSLFGLGLLKQKVGLRKKGA